MIVYEKKTNKYIFKLKSIDQAIKNDYAESSWRQLEKLMTS